jgi:hypothetical protein
MYFRMGDSLQKQSSVSNFIETLDVCGKRGKRGKSEEKKIVN